MTTYFAAGDTNVGIGPTTLLQEYDFIFTEVRWSLQQMAPDLCKRLTRIFKRSNSMIPV